jgi:hypothetical protein
MFKFYDKLALKLRIGRKLLGVLLVVALAFVFGLIGDFVWNGAAYIQAFFLLIITLGILGSLVYFVIYNVFLKKDE